MSQNALLKYAIDNRSPHVVEFPVTSNGFSSEEWIEHAEKKGHGLTPHAMLTLSPPDYNEKHRLSPGKKYQMALVMGGIIPTDFHRTTLNMVSVIQGLFGKELFDDLRGEFAFLVADKLEELGLPRRLVSNIVVPHSIIVGVDGVARVLGVGQEEDEPLVKGYFYEQRREWDLASAFICVKEVLH